MKRFILSLFLCIFAGTFELKSEQEDIEEAYEQAFVKRMNSEYVTCKDGKVIFYPDDSSYNFLKRCAGVVAIGAGLVNFSIAAERKNIENLLIVGGFSAVGACLLKSSMSLPEENAPCLILDSNWIYFNGGKFSWKSVKRIEIDKVAHYYNDYHLKTTIYTGTERILRLFDKFGAKLLWVSSNGPLPISLDCLIALIDYYLELNGISRESIEK